MEKPRNIYKGNRYVPKIIGVWDKLISYEGLSIVTYLGDSYTSKKRVPEGIELTNTDYWIVTGNYNAQIEQYRQEVSEATQNIVQIETDLTNFITNISDKNPLYLTDFVGADPTGLTSSSLAFENFIKKGILEKRKLIVPKGLFVIDTPMSFNFQTIDLIIEGESSTEGLPNSRILWKGGAKTFFTGSNVRRILFKNIEIAGSVPPSTDLTQVSRIQAGSTGFSVDGSFEFDNVVMLGFDTLFEWKGGYYHHFRNSTFRYFNLGFSKVEAHNFNFSGCKFRGFKSLMDVVGGTGAITLNQCLIEQWTLSGITCLGATTPIINIVDSYIENYPNMTAEVGLGGNPTYTANSLIVGGGMINVKGNNIVTSGIKRVILTKSDTKNIVSLGNRIGTVLSSVKGSMEYYMFLDSNIKHVIAVDMANKGTLSQPALYDVKYVNSTYSLNGSGSYFYDPFLEKQINLFYKKELVLLNGWKKSVDASSAPKGIVKDGVVYLYGYVNKESATNELLCNLPLEFIPSEYTVLSSTTTRLTDYPSETFNIFISQTGNITIPATLTGNIMLTGLTYTL